MSQSSHFTPIFMDGRFSLKYPELIDKDPEYIRLLSRVETMIYNIDQFKHLTFLPRNHVLCYEGVPIGDLDMDGREHNPASLLLSEILERQKTTAAV